ncbi:CoA ester lyase [Microtetraspora sp. NBRC 16547]|uniref:HpcH/HpaI aldolase/citrate lyase family protein n=1 Tax=Microtetraspora sp. NBRC 16547 TaxID=3030993 RepID=UPI0024A5E709|nr:CoA ester lyase [Microtetraspora sp. NBRC 16547]GLX02861.1 putative citrate lyase beta chain [Microtetraspora sp. NBRC 16547]
MTPTAAPRSCLSVPGVDDRKVHKAWASEADEIVLDLEDAVQASRKAEARDLVAALSGRTAGARVAVRVNAARSAWCHLDVAACAGPDGPAESIVLPKVESAGDLEFLDRLLDGAEAASGRSEPLGVQALIETAKGLANLRDIVRATPRLRTLILGYADLGASLGRSADRWSYAQDAVLVAARSAGLAAIDGPFLGVADDEEFRRRVQHAKELGFDGKWVIHPRQIGTVNAVFTPGADEVAHARAVLDALHGIDRGAVELEGKMVDEAVAVAARRVLARVEAARS